MRRNGGRPRRRRDHPPIGTTAMRGLAVLSVLAFVGYIGVKLYNGVPGRHYGKLYVSTPVVGNLLPHDAVRIAGAPVGQVIRRELGKDGLPRLELQLDPGLKVPEDTAVALRANGLLGARYVQLIPGKSSKTAVDGATLTGGEDAYTFGLPDALDVFDGPTRTGLRQTIDGVGAGLLGNGKPLNRSVETLGTAVAQFDRVVSAVTRRDGAAERLFPSLGSAVEPLARNDPSWPALDRATARALGPLVRERTAVRDAIAAAPATARSVTSGLAQGRRLLASAHGLSLEANRVLPVVPSGLRDLAGLLGIGPGALRRTDALLKSVRPSVPGLLQITDAVKPILPDANQLVEHGQPVLDEVVLRKCDIVDFAAVMRSMTGFAQPGTGPSGPLMAFRLQPVAPLTTDVIGIKDPVGLLKRDVYSPPCRYPSTEYPQFVPRSAR